MQLRDPDILPHRLKSRQFREGHGQDAFFVFGADGVGIDLVVEREALLEAAGDFIGLVGRDEQQVALDPHLEIALGIARGEDVDQVAVVLFFDSGWRVGPLGETLFPVLTGMMMSAPIGVIS